MNQSGTQIPFPRSIRHRVIAADIIPPHAMSPALPALHQRQSLKAHPFPERTPNILSGKKMNARSVMMSSQQKALAAPKRPVKLT
jgi:hypothetical protein